MIPSQLSSLRHFDDDWRSLAVLKRRGVEPFDVSALVKLGFVEVRVCGAEYYRITPAGWRELRKWQG